MEGTSVLYYNENLKQTIYRPDVTKVPVHQKSFYSNSTQKQIRDLDNFYQLLNEKLDILAYDLYKKNSDVYFSYRNLVNLQKKADGELLQQKNKQENLKVQLLNQISQLENIISQELKPFITSQENVNSQVVELLDSHDNIITQELKPFIISQENANRQVVEQLDSHEMIIIQEIEPYIKNIQANLSNPIANLLRTVSPGTQIEHITVQETALEIKSFVNYNLFTNISTFLLKDNRILSINTNRIDSLSIS